jgi:hypothetical protein
MSWVYHAARLNGDGTETWLDHDIPLQRVSIKDELSGPGHLRGLIAPEVARLRTEDGKPMFEPWSTVIYPEANGSIRGGFIVVGARESGSNLNLECVGFTGYAQGTPYDGEYSETNVDPLDVAREIWAHIQSQPGGNIRLAVDDTTSDVRIGTEESTWSSTSTNGNTGETTQNGGSKLTPYKLGWFANNNLGQKFDELAKNTPFDYRTEHEWDGEIVTHRLVMGYPNLGRRKHDLRFMVGENIYRIPNINYLEDDYASEVMVLGAGEGRKMIRGTAKTEPTRLRRVQVVVDKGLDSKGLADRAADDELKVRSGDVDIREIGVMDHPSAPLGSFVPGDDILVQTTEGWTDELAIWCRVLAITYEPESGVSRVSIIRTEKVTP